MSEHSSANAMNEIIKYIFLCKFNSFNLFLSAGEPPAVVEHLKPITCGLKKPATLTCRISGQPPPAIKW